MRTSSLVLVLSALALGAVKGDQPVSLLTPMIAPETASSVCVYNLAAFVLRWKLHDLDTGSESAWSSHYPVGQVKCISASDVSADLPAGASLVPKVDAFWGKEITMERSVMYDPANITQITYVCEGTTQSFGCKQGKSPPKAGNVTKDVGEFLIGFAAGLGKDIGFTECLTDMNGIYHDIVTIVDLFKSGINGRNLLTIEKAFELLGDLLKAISVAVATCGKDGAAFAVKMKAVGVALSGNAMAVIKVVFTELVHIYHERADLTADCMTTVSSWHAGDYMGSGKAVGDIAGVIIEGL